MFKNRDITVKIAKKERGEHEAENTDDEPLEEKLRRVVRVLEKPAKQLFAGICIYVVLDTFRQVQVAKASNPTNPEKY